MISREQADEWLEHLRATATPTGQVNKNTTTIFSPFFHMRNFISSSSQNYLAGMNIKRQMDALGVFKAIQAGDTSRVILGINGTHRCPRGRAKPNK